MFASAEKSKNASVPRQQSHGAAFFRKAGDESFFGLNEETSFFGPPLQAKLSVSQADDPYEKEADEVADAVMRMAEPEPEAAERDDDRLLPKPIGSIQRMAKEQEPDDRALPPASASSTSLEQALMNSKGGGSPLPASTRTFMESRFNSSFGGVRIHTDSSAQSMSRRLHAQAFTHGNDIYFNSGKYAPATADGDRLLAHELTHTIQQGAGSPASASVISRKPIAQETAAENDRGPPAQLMSSAGTIQRSLFDDAYPTITSFLSETFEEGKRLLLVDARDFVMAVPGYRALRVVLGEDPITAEPIERNGNAFIEAAFDIMPGGALLHEKLRELGALQDAAAWIDVQISTVESLVYGVLARLSQFIESITIERLASPSVLLVEAGNIIRNAVRSIVSFAETAARALLETVKRFLVEQIVAFIRGQTPAYPLLCVLLGKDPITDEDFNRNGTNILDALLELGGEEGREQRRQMQETGTFERVAGWIDAGIAVFDGTFGEIKAGFLGIWNSVSIEMLMHPTDAFQQIYHTFAAPLGRILHFVSQAGNVILAFIKEVLMRRLSAWARTVGGYPLITVIIGKDPFTDEIVPFNIENLIRGFMSLMDGGDAQFDQLKESGAIERTTAPITAAIERLHMTPAAIIQLFIGLWNSFSIRDLADPPAAFQRIIARFGEPIERLIAFVVEVVRIVIEVILQLMSFPSDLIASIITKSMQAFEQIKADPVGFLKNLLRAVKQGFIQFFDNMVQHLTSGLLGWLTSELREAGVPELRDTSLRGVIGWVLQILDISIEKIWEKLAAHPRIGPARVARIRAMINTLEGIWTFIKDVQERGIAAIWDKIQEQLTNLWDTILGAVKNWIMEQIVNRVATRLMSMLDPSGIMAVVNSAVALYSAIESFSKYLREMLEIVNSFVEGVVDIASGNITTAANYLEQTMSRAVPVVIGFLANQVGLSGIGSQVAEMIGQARELVDQALDWLVNKAVELGGQLLDMGRAAADTVMGWLGFKKEFRLANGEEHELYFEDATSTAPVMVASKNAQTLQSVIASKSWNDSTIPDLKVAALRAEADYINARRENQSVRNGTEIKEAFDRIVLILSTVSGTAVPTTTVVRQATRGSGSALQGQEVFIKPLSLNPGGLVGTVPTVNSDMGRDLLDRYPGRLVEGHLLNHNMHGPGNLRWNLSPISHATNNAMKLKTEAAAKSKVLQEGKVISYCVKVNYKSALDPAAPSYPEGQIADSIETRVEELVNNDGNWIPASPQPPWALNASGTIPHDTGGIPGFGGTAMNMKVNLNWGSERELLRLRSLGRNRVDAILNYRKNPANRLQSGNFFDRVEHLSSVGNIPSAAIASIKTENKFEI